MSAAVMVWSTKAEEKAAGYGGRSELLSARAQEIARSREEMLGLLHGLPESEYELSLTDLVERSTPTAPVVGDGEGAVTAAAGEEAAAAAKSAGQGGEKAKDQSRVRRSSSERRPGGGGGGSCREGVLLNVYFPTALCRSLTESRVRRTTSTGKRLPEDCVKRERKRLAFSCWSAIWERRRAKARTQ